MQNAYISGTGSYLPANIVNNRQLFPKIQGFNLEQAVKSLSSRKVDAEGKPADEIFDLWVRQVAGIVQRTYISEDECDDMSLVVEHMGMKAARLALEDAELSISDIDHIIFSTYSADIVIPPPVATLSSLLEAETVSGITLNGVCSGFMDALIDAAAKVNSGTYRNVLIVSSEYLSNKMDYSDITTAILFSDGAGACVVSAGDRGIYESSARLKYSNEHINMSRSSNIQMGGGPLVQRKAVNAMYEVTARALEKSKTGLADISYIIPHQANIRILNSLEDKLKLPGSCSMVKCIADTGNLSSATLPVAMDRLVRGKFPEIHFSRGKKAVLVSVGGGYTYSAAVVKL